MSTILITGASRGMGADAARRLAEQGHTIIAGVREPALLAKELQSTAETLGLPIHPVQLDVTDDASVTAAVEQIRDAFPTLDVLVNNAGVPGTWAGPDAVGPKDFTAVFATNVLGPVRVTQAFLPLLLSSNTPRLVMVSSGMGSFDKQLHDPDYAGIAHLPYPASKAAVNMLAVQYAKALPQVLVTAVDPGLTATRFTNGVGQSVEDGADVIVSAAVDTTGPSGRFLDRNGESSW